jgi:hypothetical protein
LPIVGTTEHNGSDANVGIPTIDPVDICMTFKVLLIFTAFMKLTLGNPVMELTANVLTRPLTDEIVVTNITGAANVPGTVKSPAILLKYTTREPSMYRDIFYINTSIACANPIGIDTTTRVTLCGWPHTQTPTLSQNSNNNAKYMPFC